MTQSEASIQQRIRLAAGAAGVDLWRNNSGCCEDKTGRLIRYGLANESKALNDKIKSSDLIGVRSVLITQEMVGQVVGLFTAIECKSSDWAYRPTDNRAVAQLRYMDIVRRAGGLAGFATSVDEARAILRL